MRGSDAHRVVRPLTSGVRPTARVRGRTRRRGAAEVASEVDDKWVRGPFSESEPDGTRRRRPTATQRRRRPSGGGVGRVRVCVERRQRVWRACEVLEGTGEHDGDLAAAAVSDRGRLRQSLPEFGRERRIGRREEGQELTGVLSE